MANQHTKARDERQRATETLLANARARFKAGQEAERDFREEYALDMKFRAGEQWPEAIKSLRDRQKKPCLTINRLQQFEKQVTNGMRQAMPAIQVSPGDHKGDDETAEVLQGLVRHIEDESDASVAYERGGTSSVRGGKGFWIVRARYVSEESFDQELYIDSVRDALMVTLDPASQKPDGSDAKWAFVYADMPVEEFQDTYPNASTGSDEGLALLHAQAPDWLNGHEIRVAEHYFTEYEDGTIYETKDGQVTTDEPKEFKRKRSVRIPKVRWVKMTGNEILEGPLDLPIPWIPVVPCYGDEMVLDGKVIHEGIIRNARDSVRMANYWASKEAETIALGASAPFIMAEGQEEGHEAEWADANNADRAYLLYKPTSVGEHLAPAPQRNVAEPAIQAISAARMQCIEDLKAVTGIFDPSLGNRDAAQSGVAIRQLQAQGGNANYHFSDNQHRSIKHTGRILVAWIPYIYDTERVIRIISEDGDDKLVTINGPRGQKDPDTGEEKVFDLKKGKYHVVLSAGPSFQTRRQEEAAFLEKVMQAWPQIMQVAGDLIMRSQDSPGAQALAERLKKTLPPQLQDEDPNAPQTQIPPQVRAQVEQAKQMIAALTQQLHDALGQLDSLKAQADTKIQIASMQEETKRLVALLTTGQRAAAVQLENTIGVLDAQATRDHQMTMSQLPPQAQPAQPGGDAAPTNPTIPAPADPSGLSAGMSPQEPTSFAGAPGAGQE